MPLRSVEAATRDDAIAAAREQFGPTARVVGVRRVRSGGVLGFFATERYVAEVAADSAGRPAVPVTAASRSAETGREESPADFSSPLASAAPARARAAAPARNGAAAWAAEAARTSRDLPVSSPAAVPASSPALPRVTAPAPDDSWPAAAPRASAPARTGSQPAMPRADQERVSELAGLLTSPAAAPESPAYPRYTRAEFQRAGSPQPRDEDSSDDLPAGGFAAPAASASAAPSPFTAALARMVAGDRDVRQAVREALDDAAAPRPRDDGDSRPIRPGALGPADTSVASPATRQKEETVGDQVIAPSMFADQPVDVPAWAVEPEVPAPSASSREEAIAEVLRAALAQGHSDEALAGILRKVLAGVAPQTALAEPEVPVRATPEVVVPVDVTSVVAPAVAPAVAPVLAPVAPEVTAPEAPAAVESTPAVEAAPAVEFVPAAVAAPAPAPLFPASPPAYVPPAPLFSAPAPYFAAPAPYSPPPLFAPSLGSMWGDPSPATLWGDPVTVAVPRPKVADSPIWAEVAQEATSGSDLAVEADAEPAAVDSPVEQAAAELPAVEDAPLALEGPDTFPADDVAVEHEVPVLETSAVEAPVDETPVDDASVDETSVFEISIDEASVVEASASDTGAPEAPALDMPPLDVPAVEDLPRETPGVEMHSSDAADVEAPAMPAAEVEIPAAEVAVVETPAAEAEVAEEVAADAVADMLVGTEEGASLGASVDVDLPEIPLAEQADEVATDDVVQAAPLAETEAESEAGVAVETRSEGDSEAEVAVELDADAVTIAETQIDARAEIEAATDAEAEAPAETAAQTEAAAETIAETQTETVAEAEAAAETAAETQTETVDEAEAAAETAAQTETAAETEIVAETAAEVDAAEAEAVVEAEAMVEELTQLLARTASDPAPMMSLDATTVMPPLSLLPPLPSSRGRGRPPVPPASRPLTPRASAPAPRPPARTPEHPDTPPAALAAPAEAPPAGAPGMRSLATVTRLPVAPLMATPETPEMPELDADGAPDAPFAQAEPAVPMPTDEPHVAPSSAAAVTRERVVAASGDLGRRLEALGLPGHLLGETFADDVASQGIYAALTRSLGLRLRPAPELPNGAGEVLFVVGPGFESLRTARSLAVSLRLDPDSVQWATRGELAGLAGKASRITTVETAMDRSQDAASSGTVTIVAVDSPLRTDAYWMSQMLSIWSPTAVWAVVEATRKPEDLGPWIDGLPRVDALVVTDTDLSADPAAVLRQAAAPVALLDGVRATSHRWASLLCERLENTKA